MPPLAVQEVRGADMIYLILRSVGWPEERMSLDGLDDLPFEPFEVIAPIEGVSLNQEATVGEVRLVPGETLGEPLTAFGFTEDSDAFRTLAVPFRSDVYAVALVPAARTFDAEHAGIRSIDVALGWLIARTRYGLARAPNGHPVRFRRAHALVRPGRRDVVYTRGLETGQRIVRVPGSNLPSTSFGDEEFDLFSGALPRSLSLQDEQAILACRRAVTEEDPLGRVTALWEAIEFYTAGTRTMRLFPSSLLASIKKNVSDALPGDLTSGQRARITQLLGDLNSPPLLTRLREALDQDGVPISDGDIALLQRLRRLRNDAVHGRSSDLPTNEELDHSISIVSRMLLYRLARLSV